jgi:PAS domain S-box-containing protein
MPNTTSAQPLVVLLVDSRRSTRLKTVAVLSQSGYAATVREAHTEPELDAALRSGPDLILAGLDDAGLGALRVLTAVRAANVDIPVILLGKLADEAKAMECLARGAADALLGNSLNRLGGMARRALADRQAKRDLEYSQRIVISLFETNPQAILLVDDQGMLAVINRRAEIILGYEGLALRGEPAVKVLPSWSKVVFPPTEPPTGTPIYQWSVPQISTACAWGGRSLPVEISLMRVTYFDGQFWAVMVVDKTEQIATESALASTEQRYQDLVEQIPVVTFRVAINNPHTAEYISPQIEQLTGFSLMEWLEGDGIWENQIHPEDRKQIVERTQKAMREGTVFEGEYRLMTRQGEIRWIYERAQRLPADLGAATYYQGVMVDMTELRQAEQAMQESEERFRSIVENATIGIVVHVDGKIVYANQTSTRMIGACEPEDLNGQRVIDFVHPDDQHLVFNLIQQAFISHIPSTLETPPFVVEERLVRLDGAVVTVEASALLINYYGKPGLLVMMNDITQRKQAEAGIRESEAKFRSYIEHAPMAVLVSDQKGVCLEANPAAGTLFGMDPRTMSGSEILDLFAVEDRETAVRDLSVVLEHNFIEGEYHLHRLNGEKIWVSMRGVKLDDHQFIAFCQDTTERHDTLEALQQSETRFRTLIEQAPAAIGIVRDGNTMYANPPYLRLFGIERLEDIVGHPFIEQIAPQSRTEAYERARRREIGQPAEITFDTRGLRRDGTEFPFHTAVTRVELIDGPATLAFFTDITQLKQTEQELRNREHQLDQIIQQMPFPVGITDPDGVTRVVNQAFLEMFHIPSQESVIGKFNVLTDPWMTRSGVMERSLPAYRGEVVYLPEVILEVDQVNPKHRTAETKRLCYEITIFPVFREDHQISQVVTIWRDIQQRIEDEEAIRESEERYRTLFETMFQGVTYHDATGRLISANRAAIQMFDLTVGHVLGDGLSEGQTPYIHEDGSIFAFDDIPVIKALRTGKEAHGVIMGKLHPQTNRFAWIIVSSIPEFRKGDELPYRVFTTFEDITALRETEQALRQTSQMLEAVIQASPLAIDVLDLDGIVRLWSPAKERLFGWTAAEVIGKPLPFIQYMDGEESRRQVLEKKEGEIQIGYETQRPRKDGTLVDVSIAFAPIYNGMGQVSGSMSILTDITRQKTAERALRESEARFRAIFESAAVGIVVADSRTGMLIQCNQVFQDMVGFTEAELRKMSIQDITYPEDLENETPFYRELISGQRHSFQVEKRYLTKAGPPVWTRVNLALILTSQDPPLAIGVVENITEQKRADLALLESEARLKLAQQVGEMGSFEWDFLANTSVWSDQMEAIFGVAPGKGSFNIWVNLIHPEDRSIARAKMDVVFWERQPEISGEYRFVRPDGEMRWLNLRGLVSYTDAGVPMRMIGIVQDVTVRKQSVEKLQNSEARFRAIFESAAVGIVLMDAKTGRLVQANSVFQTMLGYSAAELEGMTVSEFTHPEDMQIEARLYQELLEGKRSQYQLEKRFIAKSGRTFWARLNVSPVIDTGNRWLGIGIAEDITDRKTAEDLLRHQMEENYKRKQELEAIIDVTAAMRRAQTRPEMIDLIMKQTLQVMDAQAGALALLNGTSLVFYAAVGEVSDWNGKTISQDDSIFWQVIRDGLPKFVAPETPQNSATSFLSPLWSAESVISTGIFTPLKNGETTIGLLFLGYTAPNTFSGTQIRLAVAIADLAGSALHRTSIADALEQIVADRTRDLETIYQVAAASREQTDLSAALQATLNPILTSVGSQIGVIVLIDEKTKLPHILAAQGLPPQIYSMIENSDDQNSIEAWVLKHKLPLILPDLTVDPRAGAFRGPPVQMPFVALPMRIGERIVGILEIARINGRPFDLEELTLLFFIADHMGLVVENTSLLHRAEQHAILEERGRLARELHDSVTQSLYSATLFAEGSARLAEQGDLKQVREKLVDLSQITQQALKEMRLLVYELRSPALRSEGLVRAIQHRLEAVEMRAGIRASLDSDLLPQFSDRLEEGLYRITLEALNNSLKHAYAKNVGVTIRIEQKEIVLYVKDDGKGFNQADLTDRGGMGMTSMQERAERLKGSVQVRSESGSGTEVEVRLPWSKKFTPKTDKRGVGL